MRLNHYPAITSREKTYRQTTLSNSTTLPTLLKSLRTNRRTDRLHLSLTTLEGFTEKTPLQYNLTQRFLTSDNSLSQRLLDSPSLHPNC